MNYPVISADSHITEPAETYVDYIDPAFAERAPRLQDCGDDIGDAFIVDGFPRAALPRHGGGRG